MEYQKHDVIREDRPDGSILLRARQPLGEVSDKVTDWLDEWAARTPSAVFLAERSGEGWREEPFGSALEKVRAYAAGLLDLGLGPDKPLLIISGNSIEHGLLTLAAQYVGVPAVPLAEQYAAIPGARAQLDFAVSLVRPGAVFAEDGDALADALARPVFEGITTITARGAGDLTLAHLSRRGGDVTTANAGVGPETVAKILLTSGSTSSPKGVLSTNRMLCINQAQIRQAWPFLAKKPPLIVDWLPWNHTFGGSHNFNMILANGGSLYVDDGKPAPHLVGRTFENLRLKTGTLSFNVPAGFAAMRDVMRDDAALRRSYFENLDMLFYAGASLPPDVWNDLADMAIEVRGDMPMFTSSWGLTETAPTALSQCEPTHRSGIVGVPVAGLDIKLIPAIDDRFEIRVRGPNVFQGYLNDSARTKDAFDEDGFFRTGDTMTFVDPSDMNAGLAFAGRISEDFKLMTGTWVRASAIRLAVLGALKGIAMDVVLTGEGRGDVGLLIVPTPPIRDGAAEADGALIDASIAARISERLAGLGGSSSSRIARALLLSEPPSMADGEITAKGNLNFPKLLGRRGGLVDRLYDDHDPATIRIDG